MSSQIMSIRTLTVLIILLGVVLFTSCDDNPVNAECEACEPEAIAAIVDSILNAEDTTENISSQEQASSSSVAVSSSEDVSSDAAVDTNKYDNQLHYLKIEASIDTVNVLPGDTVHFTLPTAPAGYIWVDMTVNPNNVKISQWKGCEDVEGETDEVCGIHLKAFPTIQQEQKIDITFYLELQKFGDEQDIQDYYLLQVNDARE